MNPHGFRHKLRPDGLACAVAAHGLAFGLAIFAAGKFLRTMFSLPNSVWDTPVAELSGLSATWAYFGSSAGYSTLLGLVELVGGVLVLSRRTRLVGLGLVIPLLLNIVAIDVFYGVRPGIYAALGLLTTALFLLASDGRRVREVWRIVVTPGGEARDRAGWKLRAFAGIATIGAGLLVLVPVARENAAARSDLDGIWIVDDMKIDGGRPHIEWQVMYFELLPRCAIRIGRDLVPCRFSASGREVEIDLPGAVSGFSKLKGVHARASPKHLLIEGTLDGRELRLELIRKPTPSAGRGW